MTLSLIRNYDVIIVILMSQQLKKWKVFIVFVFGWIKLKFGERVILGLSFQILTEKRSISSKSEENATFLLLDHDF